MEGKKSFILYCDQRDLFDQLSDEQAGQLIKHIYSYVNDENPISKNQIINLAFTPIKQSLKRDLKKWEKQHKQRIEAGKKSAESRRRNSTTVNERSISSTDSVSVSVSVSDSVSDSVINIPTQKEFLEYALSKDECLDHQSLKLKYDSWIENGWKDGNDKKIKSWKSKLNNTIPYLKKSEVKKTFSNNSHLFTS